MYYALYFLTAKPEMGIIISVYRRGKRGSERLSNFVQVLQAVSTKDEIGTWLCSA